MVEPHANVVGRDYMSYTGKMKWRMEESCSLKYRWQHCEAPVAPVAPVHRGRDICYCTVNQRKYDGSKGQFRARVFEEFRV